MLYTSKERKNYLEFDFVVKYMIYVRKTSKKDDILIFDPKIRQIRYLW